MYDMIQKSGFKSANILALLKLSINQFVKLLFQFFSFPLRPHLGAKRTYQDEPEEAAPSWPVEAAQGCQGISVEPPEPQHDPGSL